MGLYPETVRVIDDEPVESTTTVDPKEKTKPKIPPKDEPLTIVDEFGNIVAPDIVQKVPDR